MHYENSFPACGKVELLSEARLLACKIDDVEVTNSLVRLHQPYETRHLFSSFTEHQRKSIRYSAILPSQLNPNVHVRPGSCGLTTSPNLRLRFQSSIDRSDFAQSLG